MIAASVVFGEALPKRIFYTSAKVNKRMITLAASHVYLCSIDVPSLDSSRDIVRIRYPSSLVTWLIDCDVRLVHLARKSAGSEEFFLECSRGLPGHCGSCQHELHWRGREISTLERHMIIAMSHDQARVRRLGRPDEGRLLRCGAASRDVVSDCSHDSARALTPLRSRL